MLGDVDAEGLCEIHHPVGEQAPVLARRAEQRADDRNRIRPGDVGDEVAMAGGGVPVDKLGDYVDACAAHPFGGTWGERRCDEAAQPLVLGAVEVE